MQFSAGQIAQLLEGKVDGNAQVLVHDLAKIEEGKPGTLTFLSNTKYTEYVYTTGASVVIVANDFKPTQDLPKSLTLIRVANPYACFAKLLEMQSNLQYDKFGYEQPGYVSSKATVGENVYLGAFTYVADGAVIEDNVKIFPNCYIGEQARIGKGTRIHAGVKIYPRCEVGANCLIHSGVVIGGDGFGFAPKDSADYEKVPQIGNVIIEDAVEIGSNTTIDRATMGSTVIRRGVKLDNLIQVAHNVEIGEHTVIAAQTGIAGSTKIGKRCMIGGQVGIVGHLTIADEVKIAAQSGIGHSITEVGKVVQGSPAFGIGEYKRSYVMFRSLPDIKARVDAMEKELKALKDLQA